MPIAPELPVIQRVYDLILWYVPRLSKLSRDFKFIMGDRIQETLLRLLEGLILARSSRERLPLLGPLNPHAYESWVREEDIRVNLCMPPRPLR